MTDKVQLSVAVGDHDHTRDVTSGRVPVEGASLIVQYLPPEEVHYRFTVHRDWDMSEMSMGKYISLRSQDDTSISAIPVFPSRMFRHSMIYVRNDGKITRPEQLKGKRIGIPEWAQTATIYSRGYLQHEAGVPLTSVEWVQAGVNEAGRVEKVKLNLPKGVSYRNEPGDSLNNMLLAGKLDAVLSARPPLAYDAGTSAGDAGTSAGGAGASVVGAGASAGGAGIVRLFENYEPVEEAYFRKTGIFPIMHVIVIRTALLERHPWLAMNLYKAFDEAKERSVERMSDITASHAPLAWMRPYTERMKSLFGEDIWPYGVEKNRTTLEAFLQFGYEQGVCHRKLAPEELFPKQVLSVHKV
ncbi:MAG: 4,5-dihydroxyphthalate decarboxylase [Betaproteobacteria bacterium]|nr:4,5-dihydroxyphthalate decarboxylase [Betaproteobacteria bacterium]